MKINFKSISKFLPITIFALFFSLVTGVFIYASNGQNIAGYAWSSNVGWLSLNNCTDPSNASTCTGTDYGLSVIQKSPGTVDGYAWSSNIGWVSFNAAEVGSNGGCPNGSTCQAHVDWSTSKMYGWARACSVFASGCSGSLKDSVSTGGWDGFISLNGSKYGVQVNSSTKVISGYGWGSDVVGWVEFKGTYNPLETICTLPALLDTTTNKCVTTSCPLPSLLNTSNGKCETASCTLPQTLQANGVCGTNTCTLPSLLNTSNGKCETASCTLPQTLQTNGVCGTNTCTAPKVFDSVTNSCQNCASGTTYNTATKSCVDKKKPIYKEI